MQRSMICAAVLAVSVSACTPSVNSVSVSPGTDVNLVNVQANISTAPAASMGTPAIRVASLAGNQNPPDSAFHAVPGGFTVNNAPNHRLDGLALPAGQFRVEVQQPYTALFTSTQRVVSRSQDTTVTIPQGCFFFDGDIQGWTTDGFEIRTTSPTDFGTRVNLCTAQSPVINDGGANFPRNFTSPVPGAFRSLALPLNPLINTCFSQPTPSPQSGSVVVDFISPNLSGMAGWENANGFEMQVRGAPPSLSTPAVVKAQLLLRDTAGTFFRQEDAQNQPQFVDLGGTFAPASFARAGTTLSEIHVRIFVPFTGAITPDTGADVDIDRVCPKTAP